MAEQPRTFDVCILCALYKEAQAVIDEFQLYYSVTFSAAFSRLELYNYRHTLMQNSRGEPLTILVSWFVDSGPIHAGLDLKPFLHEFQPRFAAMTGICAGNRAKVQLGDLVVAEYAYHYDEGKMREGLSGQIAHQPEMKTVHPTNLVVQCIKGFDGWKTAVRERFPQTARLPDCYIAPMASGMAVRVDNPFPHLTEYYNRKTLAVDMEAATFYLALRGFPFMHGLVVKGICDYADGQKNDHYHDFAARASAIYILHFISEYVNNQIMPLRDSTGQILLGRTARSSTPTNIRVTSSPSREGNKAVILFVLHETEHALEYIRRDEIRRQILFLKERQQELVRLVVPFATLKPLKQQAAFQIDGVDCLLTFQMSAIASIMNIKVEVGGVEVFHN